MIAVFKTALSVILSALCFLTSPVFGNFAADTTYKKENCGLKFGTISDAHINGISIRETTLNLALWDFANADEKYDALVFVGDQADSGSKEEYEAIKRVIGNYGRENLAKNIIWATGNHDTWTENEQGEDDLALAQKYFTEYRKEFSGVESDKMYYSTQINGYPFIVLGSEEDHTNATFTEEQLQWFEGEMEKASKTGKPIFVISHWPLNETHGLPENWEFMGKYKDFDYDKGGIGGEASNRVLEAMKKYDNVFYITGHIHAGFSNKNDKVFSKYLSVYDYEGIHLVNCPCLASLSFRGRMANGTGFVFEAYDDEVIIRGRSYTAGVWYSIYEYSIPLTKN